jgi:hypothetical protein
MLNAITIHPIKRRDWLTLVLILFVAALMRFSDPGVVEFFHDDAMLSTLAQDMVSGGRFPLTGINSSVGIPNPPTSVYMMAIPFALDSNPATAIFFVMLLNTAGVGILWLFVHRYFGKQVALIAGLAYALNPWAVLFSRKIWAQELHTPLILLGFLLAIYGLFELVPNNRRRLSRYEWAQMLSLPVICFAFQIHFAAWALVPAFLAIFWVGRHNIAWRALIAGCLLALLVSLPYLIGLAQTLERDPTRISAAAARSDAATGLAFTIDPVIKLTYLATGLGMETWIAPAQQQEINVLVQPFPIWWLLIGLLVAGTILLWQKKYRHFAPLIILWAFLPALALVPRWTDVYVHYFIPSIPPLMLLLAIGAAWIIQLGKQPAIGRTVLLSAVLFILLTQGVYWRGLLRFVNQTDITYPGFTVPLHYLEQIEDVLASEQDVVVLSQGMAWDLHHESAVWPILLRDTASCVRTLIGDGYAVFPAHPFAVLQTPDMPEQAVGGLYFTDQPVTIPTRLDSPAYVVYRFAEAPVWNGAPITAIDPVRYENDVLLTGYHLSTDLLMLEWKLPRPMPGLNYQYSTQFFSADGEKIGQRDTIFWHGRHWCENDRLLTWMRFETPTNTASMRIILYRLGAANEQPYINAAVLDAAGNPVTDYAEIIIQP